MKNLDITCNISGDTLTIKGKGIISDYSLCGNTEQKEYCTDLIKRKGITSVIIEDILSIGDKAFYDCDTLESVTISESVKSIGYGAFWGCIGLKSIIIPNSVTSIGNSAFSGCYGLKSIIIGDSVKSIADNAFYDCRFLGEITNYSITPQIINSNVFTIEDKVTCILQVPAEAINDYYKAAVWKDFKDNIFEIY